MEKSKKTDAHKQDEGDRDEVNWQVVLTILIVMGAIFLYVIFV